MCKESRPEARLRVHLPGEAHLEITNGAQAGLAAVLLENLGRLGAKGLNRAPTSAAFDTDRATRPDPDPLRNA